MPCGLILKIDIGYLEVMPWEILKIGDRIVEQIIPSITEIKDKIEDQYPKNIELAIVYQCSQELYH